MESSNSPSTACHSVTDSQFYLRFSPQKIHETKQNPCKSTPHRAGQATFNLAFGEGSGHLRIDPFSWAFCAYSLSGCYRVRLSCNHSGQISSSGPTSPVQHHPKPGSPSFPFQLQEPNDLESLGNHIASYKEGRKFLPEGSPSFLHPPQAAPTTGDLAHAPLWMGMKGKGSSPHSQVYPKDRLALPVPIPRSPLIRLIFTVPPH